VKESGQTRGLVHGGCDEFGADEAGAADDNDFHGFVFGVEVLVFHNEDILPLICLSV